MWVVKDSTRKRTQRQTLCKWYFITVLTYICCVLDGNIHIKICVAPAEDWTPARPIRRLATTINPPIVGARWIENNPYWRAWVLPNYRPKYVARM